MALKFIKNIKNTIVKSFIGKIYIKRIVKKRNKTKIFVIGRNKTGTTSMAKALRDLGFIIANQREAELLQKFYQKNKFKRVIQYCNRAEVFQDYPFSHPNTFKYVDKAFPNSKFILTIRDSPEQWYNSVVKFHSKLFGKGSLPSKGDLENALYVEKGWLWKNFYFTFNPQDLNHIYDKDNLMQSYMDYNQSVIEYFKNRPNDLLILNLSEAGAYQKFIDFIGIKSSFYDFPWKNKTSEIETKK